MSYARNLYNILCIAHDKYTYQLSTTCPFVRCCLVVIVGEDSRETLSLLSLMKCPIRKGFPRPHRLERGFSLS